MSNPISTNALREFTAVLLFKQFGRSNCLATASEQIEQMTLPLWFKDILVFCLTFILTGVMINEITTRTRIVLNLDICI